MVSRYDLIASAVFSLPNLASIGLSEEEARERGHRLKIFHSSFRPTKLSLTDVQERTHSVDPADHVHRPRIEIRSLDCPLGGDAVHAVALLLGHGLDLIFPGK